ncbi:MAG: thiamine phosphate synthase [Parvularculaceae bacterium]
MTDAARIADPAAVARALPPDACVILRDYDHPARAEIAARLTEACRASRAALLVGADAALAEKIGADGVHLPERMIDRARAVRRALPDATVTCAAHNSGALFRAAAAGCDAALLSPAFATQSHPGAAHLGVAAFRELAAAARLPVLALGGIRAENALSLIGSGAAGLAAIGAFSEE